MKSRVVFFFKYFCKYFLKLINYPLQKKRTVECYITCSGNSDGVGAQAHAILSTILFAKLYGLEYVHTPFTSIQHNNSQKKEWEKIWESFFLFGVNKLCISSVKESVSKTYFLKHPLLLFKKYNFLYVVRNCHEFVDFIPDSYPLILNEIRTNFRRSHFVNVNKIKQVKKISIHLRRGDVSNYGVNANRCTDFSVIIKLLNIISDFLIENNIQYEVDIYSQGKENDFVDFRNSQTNLKINHDEFETFKGLMNSDILIMAKSSFSYTAALLSEGLIFYDKFWHKPLKSWVNYRESNIKTIRAALVKYFNNN
jgi:hypothetical protein